MKIIALLLAVPNIAACSTYSVARYSVHADNIVALRRVAGAVTSVGAFSAATGAETEIWCRAVGPIKTPDNETFSEYVRKALLDELRIANVYAAKAPSTLTGDLGPIELSSTEGRWTLALTVTSSNGRSVSVNETFAYASSFLGDAACQQSAQAFMPAVQDLIGKIVRSEEFPALIASPTAPNM